MKNGFGHSYIGYVAMAGGVMGLLLAPVMVIIKYMTGWAVVSEPAYAVHMMGMNFVMVGSMTVGVSALRRKFLAPWLAWSFVLIFPSAVVASMTILPTTPSGALWLFSVMMIACGYFLNTTDWSRKDMASVER